MTDKLYGAFQIGQTVPVDDWGSWLAELDESRQPFAVRLRDRFGALGCQDPEGWTRSEIDEDIAQLTRFLFCRATWKRMTEIRDLAMRSDVARRLVADGTDPERLQRLVQVSIGQLAFDMLFLLDDPVGTWWSDGHEDIGEFDTRWRLMETHSDGSLTGREVGGLHESWGETDPEGNEGSQWC